MRAQMARRAAVEGREPAAASVEQQFQSIIKAARRYRGTMG
jgi:hypothetical protein